MELSKRINIGKNLESKLKSTGVNSLEDLVALGSQKAFLRIQAHEPDVCINTLYAIEGAIQGIRWHDLSDEIKQELLIFFRMASKN